MKHLLTFAILTLSQAAGAAVSYTGDCVVLSYGTGGSNLDQKFQANVNLLAGEKVVLFHDQEAIYSAVATGTQFAGTPATSLILEIADAKTGNVVSSTESLWPTSGSIPFLINVSTNVLKPGQSNQIQCLQAGSVGFKK